MRALLARRLVLLAGLFACGVAGALEPAGDLRATAEEAASRGVPILLAVTRNECGYCATLKRKVLEPMRLSGDDPARVLVRELNVDSPEPVVGFDGSPATAQEIARGYEAEFTPTVLLVGPDGSELAERIVGINTPEFYGWYLDEAIEAARAASAGQSKGP